MEKTKSNSENTIILSHKIKIYPNKKQEEWLKLCSDYERYCWNRALAKRNEQYKIYRSYRDSGELTEHELKSMFPNQKWLSKNIKIEAWELEYHCRFKEIAIERIEQAIDNCFNPNMPNHKFPKFKKKKDFDCPKVTFRGIRFKEKRIILPRARKDTKDKSIFNIKCAEELRFNGKLTSDQTISFDGKNWRVSLSVKMDKPKIIKPTTKVKTGVDVNIGKFNFMDIDGELKEVNTLPKELLLQYDKVKFYSRKLSKIRENNINWKNSNNYCKTKTKLNNSYKKAVNIQENILNNFIKYLMTNFESVVIEDLDVNGMKMDKRIAKRLHRSMFGKFREKIESKAKISSTKLIIANRFYPSTQRCSDCSHIRTGEDKLTLYGDRWGNPHDLYVCPECGCVHDRDENAVLNLIQYKEN